MTAETITNPSELELLRKTGIETLLTGAGFCMLADVAWIRISGEDRTRWLNGMVTNSITSLATDEACYNFFLNAQGRIQGDAIALNTGESIQMITSAARADALVTMLDRFIIMDDVELQKLAEDKHSLLIAGPQAASKLREVGLEVEGLAPMRVAHREWPADRWVDVFCANSPLIPRFELWSDLETLARISSDLLAAGALRVPEEALHQLRLLEGTPLYGTDIRDKELPQETAQTRALHFAKGCYLGQEIVERIRSRGNVHRTLSGFVLSGSLPKPGSPLFAEIPGKPVGEITSAAAIPLPAGTVTLALGYIRREVLDRGIQLRYEGGTAVPTALPYKF